MTPRAAQQAVVRLHRIIPAPPDRVYRAWLDPDLVRRWLAPAGLEVTHVEVDERVGAHHRIWQAGRDGDAGGFACELLEAEQELTSRSVWGMYPVARPRPRRAQ